MQRSWLDIPRTIPTVILAVGLTVGGGGMVSSARAHSTTLPTSLTSLTRHQTSHAIYRWFGTHLHRILVRHFERLIWRMPTRRDWPLGPEGTPIVETRRLDRLTHLVRPGQTVGEICEMYRTSPRHLSRWNPRTDLGSLEMGDTLIVWTRQESTVARSHGAANGGDLHAGEPLPPGSSYEILQPHRAFGTYYTISEVRRVMRRYAQRYPDPPKLLVGDISFRTGGPMYPHKSHRTGRDVDITYPRHDEPPSWNRFYDVPLHKLDVAKTLFLIRTLLAQGRVQYIFMDHRIQRKLYRHAAEMGAPEDWLESVFEYPKWESHEAIVRHSPGHLSHMHVRFWCQPTDHRCSHE